MLSSLTTVLSSALVFSTCLPVLDYGTGNSYTHLEAFLGSMGSITSPLVARSARHYLSEIAKADLPTLDSLQA